MKTITSDPLTATSTLSRSLRGLGLLLLLLGVALLARTSAAGPGQDSRGAGTGGAILSAEAVAETAVGQGSFVDAQGNTVTFRYHVTQAGGIQTGSFSFCDVAGAVCAVRSQVTQVSVTNNSVEFGGSTRLQDGSQETFNAGAIQDPIAGTTITVSLGNGYLAAGKLSSGKLRFY